MPLLGGKVTCNNSHNWNFQTGRPDILRKLKFGFSNKCLFFIWILQFNWCAYVYSKRSISWAVSPWVIYLLLYLVAMKSIRTKINCSQRIVQFLVGLNAWNAWSMSLHCFLNFSCGTTELVASTSSDIMKDILPEICSYQFYWLLTGYLRKDKGFY